MRIGPGPVAGLAPPSSGRGTAPEFAPAALPKTTPGDSSVPLADEDFVRHLEAAMNRPRIWKWLAGIGLAALLIPNVGMALTFACFLASAIANAVQKRYDLPLKYELDDAASERFRTLASAWMAMRESERLSTSGSIAGWKFGVRFGQPPGLRTDRSVPHWKAGGMRIVMLPDALLIHHARRIRLLRYGELSTTLSYSNREEARPPRDARVVGTRWLHQRLNGGPDRRFKANYEIPTVEYGVLTLDFSGRQTSIIASKAATLATLQTRLEGMMREGANREHPEAQAERVQRKDTRAPVGAPLLSFTISVGPRRGRFVSVGSDEEIGNVRLPPQPIEALAVHEPSRAAWANAGGVAFPRSKLMESDAFVRASLASLKKTVDQTAPRVPLTAYWTTYASMNRAQERWYLRWRSEWLAGRPLRTDLSYLFVCVYELLNFTILPEQERSYRAAVTLYEEYRGEHKKLDSYLPGWLGDLAWELRLDAEAAMWWSKSGNHEAASRAAATAGAAQKREESILEHYTYPPTAHSRAHEEELRELFKRVAADADAYCQERTNQRLQEVLPYGNVAAKPLARAFYASAVIVRQADPRPLVVQEKAYSYSHQRGFEEFFQAVENAHRRLRGNKRMLKIDEEFVPKVLREYLRQRLPSLIDAVVATSTPAVTLDVQQATKIREASDAFLVTMESGPIRTPQDEPEEEAPSLAGALLAASAAASETTWLPTADLDASPLSNDERHLLDYLLKRKQVPHREASDHARRAGYLLSNVLDTLNEKAMARTGDPIAELSGDTLVLNPDLPENSLSLLEVAS